LTYEPSWKSPSNTWRRAKDAIREQRKQPTPAEAALWDILRDRRCLGFKFRRQHAIGPYIVDFYCAEAGLVIEVDGPIHDRQTENDAGRTEFLEARGLSVLRFNNEVVLLKPIDVVETIERFVGNST
jgi:very-short-patch-repair endonuclease